MPKMRSQEGGEKRHRVLGATEIATAGNANFDAAALVCAASLNYGLGNLVL